MGIEHFKLHLFFGATRQFMYLLHACGMTWNLIRIIHRQLESGYFNWLFAVAGGFFDRTVQRRCSMN